MMRKVVAPSPLRRIPNAGGTRRVVLGDNHPAIVEARTLFPSTRLGVEEAPRLLKSGHNSRKVGKMVTKGRMRGFPIYTLTLEERATCPSSCLHWRSCYGNHMQFAQRFQVDELFEEVLWLELEGYARRHPDGYLVRLHVLGDFYSIDYVRLWERALAAFPPLHVFGYTAHSPDSEIGEELFGMAIDQWERFAIRFSGLEEPRWGAVTIDKGATSPHVVCPAQRDQTDCCSTCGFCWHSQRTVAFERH